MRSIVSLVIAVAALALSPAALAQGPEPGDMAPDALGVDGAGTPVTVGQHRGKVLIVTFWASWCGPCRKELPMLAHVQKTVGRDHLEVIAVNVREPKPDYLAFVRAHRRQVPLNYVHDMGEVAARYGVRSVPHMFIIGTDGVVEHTHVGYREDMLPSFIAEMVALLPPEVLTRPAGE